MERKLFGNSVIVQKLFPKAVTLARVNFAHPTFAIAKFRDYPQSSCDMNFEYFIDPAWYPASRVALDLEKSEEDGRRLCSQDTTSNFSASNDFSE